MIDLDKTTRKSGWFLLGAVVLLVAVPALCGQTSTAAPAATTPPAATPVPCIALTCTNPPLKPPAHVEKVYDLPNLCSIEPGCIESRKIPATNAAEIVKQLANDTEFAYVANGKSSIIIFCRSDSCPDLAKATAAIDVLAGAKKPQPEKDPPGAAFTFHPLPLFCATESLDQAPGELQPYTTACSTHPVQGANAEAIATALGSLELFTVTKAGANAVTIACKKTPCAQTALDAAINLIDHMASPSPRYSEDFPLPLGSAKALADRKDLFVDGFKGLSVQTVGDSTIRVTSENPLSTGDAEELRQLVSEAGFGSPSAQPGENALPSESGHSGNRAGWRHPSLTGTRRRRCCRRHAVKLTGGMTAIGPDTIVLTDPDEKKVADQARLLTLLDLPRPEVLMNFWSLSASGPNGREVQAERAQGAGSGERE